MQQEDDLRGLAKTMEFMRAVSILFCVINVYWFCYQSIVDLGLNISVVDKILLNFQRTTVLFSSILWTKFFAVVFLALSCLGTKGVKEEKIKWRDIYICLFFGCICFFLNWWLLHLPLPLVANTAFYVFTLTVGYILLLMSGLWISRLLKNNLMDDVFNLENESFMQETRLMENEYSINLPTRFFYKKKWNRGWINVVNPFRASIVLGTPGSGKSLTASGLLLFCHCLKESSVNPPLTKDFLKKLTPPILAIRAASSGRFCRANSRFIALIRFAISRLRWQRVPGALPNPALCSILDWDRGLRLFGNR
jgi:hypothetical protein